MSLAFVWEIHRWLVNSLHKRPLTRKIFAFDVVIIGRCTECLVGVQNTMKSWNGNIFRVTGPLWGNTPVTSGFPSQRPVTRSFDVFLDLRLNKRSLNNRDGGDLRRHCAHCDVAVMACSTIFTAFLCLISHNVWLIISSHCSYCAWRASSRPDASVKQVMIGSDNGLFGAKLLSEPVLACC